MVEWHRVAAAGDIDDDDVKQVVVEGHPVGIYKVSGEFFAIDDVCTHAFAVLSEGYLEDHAIECPLHQGCFDVRTGEALNAPVTVDVRSYPVKIEGEDVMIEYEAPPKPDAGS